MFVLPKQINIDEAIAFIQTNKSQFSLKVSKLCENHCDMSINVVNIDVYPKGKTDPFDKIDAYKIQCNGSKQAENYLSKLKETLYGF